jgi:serine O-acetyltransferase
MFERIREDILSVLERDPAARNAIEIVTTYPGFHALLLHRLASRLWRSEWRWLARLVSTLARWLTGIEIHPAARIGQRFFIDHGMGVVIGETAEIGNDCTLYHGVTLGGTSWSKGKRHPTLGDNVVVGAGAKVLGPIHVGAGARIGSNAVVVGEVPPGATVVGVPGHIVRRKPTEEENGRRQAIAKKIGFDAYGMHHSMPDPLAQAIDCMLDHIHGLDTKIEAMSEALRSLGADTSAADCAELNIRAVKENLQCPTPGPDEVEEDPVGRQATR